MTSAPALQDIDKTVRDFAYQVATEVDTFDAICKAFGLTIKQGHALTRHPKYESYLHQARTEWAAVHNTAQRAELKAARATEEAIPAMYAFIHDPAAPGSAKVEAFKALGRIGKVGERATKEGASGETLKITINLGEDRKLEIEKPLPMKVINHDDREFSDE